MQYGGIRTFCCLGTYFNLKVSNLKFIKILSYIKSSILDYNKLQCQKNNLNPKEIIISKDLTENYLIKHDEIMSAHWTIQAINLFCATAYCLNS